MAAKRCGSDATLGPESATAIPRFPSYVHDLNQNPL